MILSKNRPKGGGIVTEVARRDDKPPDLEDFLSKRDYVGAITLLEFKKQLNAHDKDIRLWLAYAYFHFGEHAKALAVYQDLLKGDGAGQELHTYAAACLFYLGRYAEAEKEAQKGPKTPLAVRILFHCAHKQNDEAKLMSYHAQLGDSIEDQLSLAATHYVRSHLQEAMDVYVKLLLENRDFLALHVYTALCYSKLDHYDKSNDILGSYLTKVPDSGIAVNLKACNSFRLFNGKAAEADLAELSEHGHQENDLVSHNRVVFRGGEGALQALPPLQGFIPEARLNLIIHYLRAGDVKEAYALVTDMEPQSPPEFILKGVVLALVGQATDNTEHLRQAHQYLQLVGSSKSECDTIPGRQCMASAYFLAGQFDDVLVYLKSIKQYHEGDDDFHWNMGVALAASGQFEAAEAELLQVKREAYQRDPVFLLWVARCLVANGKAKAAWEVYAQQEGGGEAYGLLQLIAHDCYARGAFLFAARAFDALERMDPNPEYLDAKRGACAGVFQLVMAQREPGESLREVCQMLRRNPEAEGMLGVMRKWGTKNGIKGL